VILVNNIEFKEKIMKAHFILIAICIIALPSIYFINGENYHWTQLIPTAYLVFASVVAIISLWNSRRK